MLVSSAILLYFMTLSATAQSFTVQEHFQKCPKLAPRMTPPKDICDLRPDDIDVVMAVGDSITAGFGIIGSAIESRGSSFSGGGDAETTTLPNFFSYFRQTGSKPIVGASVGSHAPQLCMDPFCFGDSENATYASEESDDVFNVAMTGARHENLPTIEVPQLVNGVMNSFKNASLLSTVQDKWKFLSLMIGANDVCQLGCKYVKSSTGGDNFISKLYEVVEFLSVMMGAIELCPTAANSDEGRMTEVAEFRSNIEKVIEDVRLNSPKTIVNLVYLLDVTLVYDIHCNVPWYDLLGLAKCWVVFLPRIECPSIYVSSTTRSNAAKLIQAYNSALDDIADSYRSKYENFAVIASPALANTKFDESHLSTFDYFHPNAKAHEQMAIAIWNNLFEARGNKSTALTDFSDLEPYCPKETDRIVV